MAQWWASTNALILPFPLLTGRLNLLLSQGKIKHEEKGLFSIIIICSQAV